MSLEKIIVISSDDKDPSQSNSNSDFVVNLKERYYTQNINRILVKDILVPNSFYNVRSSDGEVNNTLKLKEGANPDVVATIPEGQYTITQLIPVLQTSIDAVLTGGNAVTIAQDAVTQKLTFTFSLTPTLIYAISEPDLFADLIGVSADTASALSVTAQFPPDLSGYNMVFIHSQDLSQYHGIDGDFGLISLLENVSLHDVPYGAFAYRQNSDDDLALVQYEQPANLNRIRIVLRDHKGNKLDIGTKKMEVTVKAFFSN